jgi:hypothetical protein
MAPQSVASSAARLRQLIDEGPLIAKREKPSSVGPYIQDQDVVPLQAWLVRVTNIIDTTFGLESPHSRHLRELMPDGPRLIQHSHDVFPIIGLLEGALDDLEGGFLQRQSLLIAGEVFDTILDQAQHLLESGYKDPGAMLGRVVLEDALRRIAPGSGVDPLLKPSRINDELKAAGRYPQPQWRLIQAWLDIGNSAAHGLFDKFTQEQVADMLQGITRFLAAELREP